MLAEAHKETFAPNLSTVSRQLDRYRSMAQAYVDEPGKRLSLSEGEDSGDETVVYFMCGDVLAWNAPRWTSSVQTTPELSMCFRELPGSADVYVASTGLSSMWAPRAMWHPRTHTDDGCTSLKSEVFSFLVDCVRSAHSYLLPSPPEETVDPPTTEPHQEAVEWIKAVSGLSWDRVGNLVGVTRPAINAWRRGGPIRDDHRQRLFAVRDVLERAAKRDPRPSELAAWLDTPRGVDAKTPAELLEAGKVGRARLLAITSPSPRVKAPSKWTQRHALEAYQESRERVRALPPAHDEELLADMSDDE
jgi:hypothetical protein